MRRLRRAEQAGDAEMAETLRKQVAIMV
jgi:hypothetical protein